MTEDAAVSAVDRPATVGSLSADLRTLGLRAGDTVMVHSSLSRLGYVVGGAHAVVLALLEAVGPDGTIVMPTHSADLSDPSTWSNPPVPESWWETLRREMPAYDPDLTPTRMMGAIVECFRRLPQARRSGHPTKSVAAVGPNSSYIVDNHSAPYGLGEQSPLARLYESEAVVLLLGVSHANNTSLHLAEHRASVANKPWTTHSSPLMVDGSRQWITYPDLEVDHSDFERLGEEFRADGGEAHGMVGGGTGLLMRQRRVVDFAVTWMEQHRS